MRQTMRRFVIATGATLGVVVMVWAARGQRAEVPRASAPQPPSQSQERARPEPEAGSDIDSRELRKTVISALAEQPPEPVPVADEEETPNPKLEEFRSQVAILNEECAGMAKCDSRQLLMDQMGLALDYKLGQAHPARQKVMDVIGWSFDERESLGQKFREGEMDRRGLFAELTTHFQAMADKLGDTLSDADYERMFGTKKGQNPATFLGLTPDMADTLDRQERTRAELPAEPERYDDPPPSATN